ncbi:hypothetical protein GGR28_001895 [Lewinella aquimaris]|uniref:T9SS type A sorting domain-containing protein n=1 Tax=Neolewinella aquimaris TaxID=1835722 RepID=A0A840E6M9_9BACT|nr:T9SS type A sorting domain-containing protein [Neolewinella aquimaris]MBB4079275.1 hypothetical protein [Neolewinella aquimaris]
MKQCYLLAFALLATAPTLLCQYAINGEDPFGNDLTDAPGDVSFTPSINGTQRFTVTTTDDTPYNFRLVTENAGNARVEVGPSGCGANSDIGSLDGSVITGELGCTGTNASFTTGGNAATYVIKTPTANQSGTFVFWRLSAPVREVNDVTSTANAGTSSVEETVSVTATLGEGEIDDNGQSMFIHYSDDGFTNSYVVAMSINGDGTFTGNIPGAGHTEGETVSYYVFTSAISSNPNPFATAVTAENADLRTITYNDNGGSYYSFLVTSPAPVTYISWTGEWKNGATQLSWSTGTEDEAAFFKVERSTNGGIDWLTLGRVEAHNRPGGAVYAFTDRNAPTGKSQYRLKQVDFDGAYKHSPIISVKAPERATALEIWPQPASANEIWLRAAGGEGKVGQLYSASGRLVATFPLTGRAQSLPTLNLTSGLYLLRIEGNLPVTRRLLIR